MEHDVPEVDRIPSPGLLDELILDFVPRDDQTGEIVDQIEYEDHHGAHRTEVEQQGCHYQREHVTEVDGTDHLDVLDRVHIHLPSLDSAVLQDSEILLEKDHVGGLLGDVCTGVDRYAHIGVLHRQHIVDPVSHQPDTVVVRTQCEDDTGLVLWSEPDEHVVDLHYLPQLLIGQRIDLRTCDDV